jgi:hypothetical protein
MIGTSPLVVNDGTSLLQAVSEGQVIERREQVLKDT